MKHKITTLLFLAGIIYTNAFAQPTIKAQRTIGGSSDDELWSMYITKDGGLIIGGDSYSNKSGEKTQNSRGDYDYWVVKLDSLGKIQWDKTIGGSGFDRLFSLQQTRDGGYILGGYSESNKSGEKTQNGKGGDFWIVKLNNHGEIQWNKTIGGNNFDLLSSLQQTSDGGYILGGNSTSNISGDKTENSRGGNDYWIVKIDGLGNIQWDKTIGGNNDDLLSSIQQTGDGGYILGGLSPSNKSKEKTQNSRGEYDYWAVKVDGKGRIQWDKTIGGNSDDQLSSIQQTRDGGYILGGGSSSKKSGEKTQNSRGFHDYWVVKLNGNGKIQWDKTIGGANDDYLWDLQQTSDEGYIIGGRSNSYKSGEKTEDSWLNFLGDEYSTDYWVVKLDKLSNIQWDKTIGGNDNDGLHNIKEVEKNNYVLGGSSGSGISGNKTQRSRGGSDYWLVKLKYENESAEIISSAGTTNSIIDLNSNKTFLVYPNPAKDILHIQTNGKAIVSLTDQSGKVLLTKNINAKGEMNVANLSAGLYYLKNTETGAVQKVMVVK